MARFAQFQFGQRPFGAGGALNGTSCAEVVACADVTAKSFAKAAPETTTVADPILRGTARSLTMEPLTIADTFFRQLCRALDELIAAYDLFGSARYIRRALLEAVAITDTTTSARKRLLQFVISGRP